VAQSTLILDRTFSGVDVAIAVDRQMRSVGLGTRAFDPAADYAQNNVTSAMPSGCPVSRRGGGIFLVHGPRGDRFCLALSLAFRQLGPRVFVRLAQRRHPCTLARQRM
jgi:hypothetical protein